MMRFSPRERLAMVLFAAIIVAGWGVRFAQWRATRDAEITLIRGAVAVPSSNDDLPAGTAVEHSRLLDINTATAEQLEQLPMIGPVKANAIVAHREAHGAFGNPAGITDVAGIGPSTYEQIREMITVGDSSGAGH